MRKALAVLGTVVVLCVTAAPVASAHSSSPDRVKIVQRAR